MQMWAMEKSEDTECRPLVDAAAALAPTVSSQDWNVFLRSGSASVSATVSQPPLSPLPSPRPATAGGAVDPGQRTVAAATPGPSVQQDEGRYIRSDSTIVSEVAPLQLSPLGNARHQVDAESVIGAEAADDTAAAAAAAVAATTDDTDVPIALKIVAAAEPELESELEPEPEPESEPHIAVAVSREVAESVLSAWESLQCEVARLTDSDEHVLAAAAAALAPVGAYAFNAFVCSLPA